jgi:geranylgeranyl diphosphate synthase, type I
MTAVIPAGVTTARDLVRPALEAALERLSPAMRQVAAYHLGLAEAPGPAASGSAASGGANGSAANGTGGADVASGSAFAPPTPRRGGAGGGKALRPALALLSVRAAGEPAERGVPAAVAVELVHNFSLLHDDIMDGDTERRHRPTAWTVFGTPAAILAGDALLALAQDILLEDGGPQGRWAARCLLAAVQRLISGQSADMEFERRHSVSMDECLTMAGDKTAALMACACSIGAIFTGAPPSLAMSLADFGSHTGLAFQLVDDLLGIWGTPEVTGKPVWSDLRTRKKSLPVVAAMAGLTGSDAAGRELGELLARPEPLAEDDLSRAAWLVEEAGGRKWAEDETARQLDVACKCLADAAIPADVRAELTEIARFVADRES